MLAIVDGPPGVEVVRGSMLVVVGRSVGVVDISSTAVVVSESGPVVVN